MNTPNARDPYGTYDTMPARAALLRAVLTGAKFRSAIDGAVDRITIAQELKAATWITGKRAATANKAYQLITDDLIGCLDEGGFFKRDGDGWMTVAYPEEEWDDRLRALLDGRTTL